MMKKVALAQASDKELRLAAVIAGIDMHPASKSDTMRAKLTPLADEKGMIQVPDVSDEASVNAAPAAAETAPAAAAPAVAPDAPVPAAIGTPLNETAKELNVFALETCRFDPKVMITIAVDQSRPGGKLPVAVGVNGKHMVFRRGVREPVPYRYYVALRNAVRTEYHQEGGEGDLIPSEVQSYNYTVHQMPNEADVRAWYRAQGAEPPEGELAA